jgi:TonB family protein
MKTRLIFLALFILLFSIIVAQDNATQIFSMNDLDTVWQAGNNKVCKKDTATYYKLYSISDEPGLFTVNQYYVTGELYMTGRVTSIKPEHRVGDFYWFYKEGGKQRKTTYKNDQLFSTIWFDPNGFQKLPVTKPVWSADGKMVEESCFVDKYPEFPGGLSAMFEFISEEIFYPSKAKKVGAEGRASVKMVIDENGKIIYAKVHSKINPYLEAEALRVVSKMPLWSPAINNGKPVSVIVNLPIVFKLPK